LALSGFNVVMSPDGLAMHTAPLYFPGIFIPLVSAFTVPENLMAEGCWESGAPFTYPGHFLGFVDTIAAALKVLVFPLIQVTVPPAANDATGIGIEDPPVLALPVHPLRVTVLAEFPVMVVQSTFPLGPAAHA